MAQHEEAEELPVRTRRAIGRLSRSLRQTQAGADLSPSQYEVLLTIVTQGPLRLAELAQVEGLNPTMLSRITAKLESFRLVERIADTDDGRVVHLAASEEGRKLIFQVRNERADALSVALKGLTEAQRQALSSALPVLEELNVWLKERRR